jgi:hypothetical protein
LPEKEDTLYKEEYPGSTKATWQGVQETYNEAYQAILLILSHIWNSAYHDHDLHLET